MPVLMVFTFMMVGFDIEISSVINQSNGPFLPFLLTFLIAKASRFTNPAEKLISASSYYENSLDPYLVKSSGLGVSRKMFSKLKAIISYENI